MRSSPQAGLRLMLPLQPCCTVGTAVLWKDGLALLSPFLPFAIRHSPFAIRHSPFAIRHLSFAICHLPFAMCNMRCASCDLRCTMMCDVRCTMCDVQTGIQRTGSFQISSEVPLTEGGGSVGSFVYLLFRRTLPTITLPCGVTMFAR
jgi:hypothetical protein